MLTFVGDEEQTTPREMNLGLRANVCGGSIRNGTCLISTVNSCLPAEEAAAIPAVWVYDRAVVGYAAALAAAAVVTIARDAAPSAYRVAIRIFTVAVSAFAALDLVVPTSRIRQRRSYRRALKANANNANRDLNTTGLLSHRNNSPRFGTGTEGD